MELAVWCLPAPLVAYPFGGFLPTGVAWLVMVVTVVLLAYGLDRARECQLGWANRVTLLRATAVAVLTALAVTGLRDPLPAAGLAVLAVALDGVDGAVARRHRVTDVGARFDMELDAFTMLVLSVAVAPLVGWWVLGCGLLRYLWWVAGYALPWLRAALPGSLARRVVAVVAALLLAATVSGLLGAASPVAAGLALAALLWSFCRDALGLWRRRAGAPAAAT